VIHDPANEAQLADVVRAARASGRTLRVEGGGSRAGPASAGSFDETARTRGLTGVTHYDPSELTLTARAGTTLAEIEAALAAKGQMLPFEPADPRPLSGRAGEPTLGGLVAAGGSGPRRLQAGSLREAVLGARFVNGRGETVKAGGRVVKNVTGLDLARLHVGALGRLGALTEITLKLAPRPPARASLALEGLDDARAISALSFALGAPFEVSGAAHLSARGLTLLRLENVAESIAYRAPKLIAAMAPFGAARRLDDDEADALWREVRDLAAFAAPDPRAVWRIATAPSRAAAIVAAIGRASPVEAIYDWGGGLIHVACPPEGDAGAQAVRAALGAGVDDRGAARLLRGPHERVPAAPDPAQPLKAAIARAFDPDGVFSPSRDA
jgi:glycolate oxidase FAD binding subunit